jgi:hypothetical protein
MKMMENGGKMGIIVEDTPKHFENGLICFIEQFNNNREKVYEMESYVCI